MSKLKIVLSMYLAMLIAPVLGHQQKESYTRVVMNERTQSLEVMHRFYLHDAEHALATILDRKIDLSTEPQSQQQFSDYVAKRFSLKDGSGRAITLQYVGFEVEGKYLWIYQEASVPENLSAFSVRAKSLQEVWPKQVNHINFEIDENVHSVRMSAQDEWQTVYLKPKN